MSARSLAAVLVLLAALTGGNPALVSDLIAPPGHSCDDGCSCGGAAEADAAPASCCASKTLAGPQLHKDCGCGHHDEHAVPALASPVAPPDIAAVRAPVATGRRAEPDASRIPRAFQFAPDPPPPREA